MTSLALLLWQTNRSSALAEFEEVHKLVGKSGSRTTHARQQINQAFVLMLSGQFQGFCRDLHSECVDHLAGVVQPAVMRSFLRSKLLDDRKLSKGNANPSALGSDFGRFGLQFWDSLKAHDPKLSDHQIALESMNEWRNRIAHQNFEQTGGFAPLLRHSKIKEWKRSCDHLAVAIDAVMTQHLTTATGIQPR
ncbi:MAG: HEPN domain-containing protein [Pirellulaceae bacterium]